MVFKQIVCCLWPVQNLHIRRGERVLLRIHGKGVSLSYLNPETISNQNKSFSKLVADLKPIS